MLNDGKRMMTQYGIIQTDEQHKAQATLCSLETAQEIQIENISHL